MKQLRKLILTITTLIITITCFVSCQTINYEDTSVQDSSSIDISKQNVENSNHNTNITTNEQSVKNATLQITSVGEKYYSMLCVGSYLGTDIPNDTGNYYREIVSFENFCKLVEHPEEIDENLFENNFVLVIKRVSGGYFADIGFKNYDTHFHSIELDSFPVSQGTDDVKITFNYIVIPKYRAQMDEDHCFVGELGIKENIKSYYAIGTEQKSKNNVIEQAKYLENLNVANSYLTNHGYSEIFNHNYNDASILLLCLNIPVEEYESSSKSCYLGFKDFNATASDIYITLERNIVNGDYGSNTEYKVFAVVIPNELLCIESIENPTIHILVHDNVSRVVGDLN